MAIGNPYQQYKKTQVDTADQGKLIVMLYDGAIKFINKAIELIPQKKIEDVHVNIVKAQDIISELMTSLNMDAGDISNRLLSIYMYINRRLIDANISKKAEPLYEVKKHLTELRDAWEIAGRNTKNSEIPETVNSGGVNIAT